MWRFGGRTACGELDLSHHLNYLRCVEEATAKTPPHLDAMIRSATAIRTAAISQPKQ